MTPAAQVFRMPIPIRDRAEQEIFPRVIDQDRISTRAIGDISPFFLKIVLVIEIQWIAVGPWILDCLGVENLCGRKREKDDLRNAHDLQKQLWPFSANAELVARFHSFFPVKMDLDHLLALDRLAVFVLQHG